MIHPWCLQFLLCSPFPSNIYLHLISIFSYAHSSLRLISVLSRTLTRTPWASPSPHRTRGASSDSSWGSPNPASRRWSLGQERAKRRTWPTWRPRWGPWRPGGPSPWTAGPSRGAGGPGGALMRVWGLVLAFLGFVAFVLCFCLLLLLLFIFCFCFCDCFFSYYFLLLFVIIFCFGVVGNLLFFFFFIAYSPRFCFRVILYIYFFFLFFISGFVSCCWFDFFVQGF